MKNILIVDTETTGIDPKVDKIIEIGAVLWSVTHRVILDCFSQLALADSNAALEVNGIPVGALSESHSLQYGIAQLDHLAARADALVAHRSEFDAGFLKASGSTTEKPWVCSKFDIRWPKSKIGDGLAYVALAHGVGVTHTHRALTDCLLLAHTFERVAESGHDVGAMLVHAMRPKAKFISLAPFEDKDLVKANSFQWDPTARVWHRTMAVEDAKALPFAVREAT